VALRRLEERLLERADLVFTGGMQLYRSRKSRHRSVHLLPSSVDSDYFGRARAAQPDPFDQATIARPRLGWFGVFGVHFVGRLATYRYYDMDQVVGQALATFKKLAQLRQGAARAA